MENKSQTDIIFTDFAKAFDRINHIVLIHKLELLGIKSSLLNWLKSYLVNRIQIVKIDNSLSENISVPSGVPQGSHLGPLLFLLYVNDIPNIFTDSSCLLFADDLKIFRKINSESDCLSLLNDLSRLDDWCHRNFLFLNVAKCQILSCFRNRNPIIFNYKVNSISLERVSTKKDLGVILDTNLSFSAHYDYMINKANRMLGFIKRNTKEFSDVFTLKSLYISMVRSVLEYNSIIWNPFYNNTLERIEKVQSNFTRFAFYKLNWHIPRPPYNSRCLLFGLNSLEDRRTYFSVMFIRDILIFHIDCPALHCLLTEVSAPSRTTRSRFLIYEQFHHSNYGRNEPISRCIRESNLICNRINFHLVCPRNVFKQLVLNVICTNNNK